MTKNLKASVLGLAKIKQARKQKGWSVNDFQWLEAASQILGVSWEETGVLAVGISEGTWKRFLAGKHGINADAFKAYCQVLGISWEEVSATKSSDSQLDLDAIGDDWQDAPDVSVFYGRDQELQTIKHWILEEKCRLITLLGMGGIGKTTLATKLARNLIDEVNSQKTFQGIIWRSLRNAPSLEDLLTELIQFVSHQQAMIPPQPEQQTLLLLEYLRQFPVLLILDNVESLLRAGDRRGRFREGYEDYDRFLRCLAETPHQSCLLLTTREKPYGLAKFEGEQLPVRSLQLSGVSTDVARSLLTAKGNFSGSDPEWETLVSRYGGNPLALKIVATSVQDCFGSSISQFLAMQQQGILIVDDIRDLLAQQFQRLTVLEQDIMYWLAVNREPISLLQLKSDLLGNVPLSDLMEGLSCLQRRSLIESSSNSESATFTQQPVVMEYVINRLLEEVAAEIGDGQIAEKRTPLLVTHALLKAQAKDYVRETQVTLILKPLIEQLITELGEATLSSRLTEILAQLRGKPCPQTGYAGGNILNLMLAAGMEVTHADFSDLTIWQAYLQGVTLHGVNFAGSDLSRCVFTEMLGNTLAAVFSPDGQILATCDTDCRIRMWEVASGKLILVCEGHQNWARSLSFRADGQVLASAGADQTIKLWNLADGVCLKTLTGHEHEIFAVAFSPTEPHLLASGSGDRAVKIWDTFTGYCLHTLTGHTDWVRGVAFSPDGEIVASASADHTIKLWTRQGECLYTLLDHESWVRSIAFSPQGNLLASGSGDGTIKLWDYRNGQCVKTYQGHQKSIYAVAFSTDGILASGSGDSTIKLWDIQRDRCLQTLQGHENEVCCVAFSPQGQMLACVSLDQTVKLWDGKTGQVLRSWYGNTDWALPVAFSPDGETLASGSNDKTIKLWHWRTGEFQQSLAGHEDFIYGLAWYKTGEILASASTDSTVRLWDVKTGRCCQILQGHTDWVYAVTFVPGSPNLIATASADCTIKIWQWRTGVCLQTLAGHTDKIFTLRFRADGQLLASASADQTAKLWDATTGHCLKTLSGHSGRVYSAIFCPRTPIIATCSTDQTIKLWEVESGECLQTLTGHDNWIFAIALSPDGQTLASVSHDQTLRIWDLAFGKCVHICHGHQRLISAVAYSSDGSVIATGSQDQTVKIWDAKNGHCLRTLIAKRLYEGMNLHNVKGLTPATLSTLQSLGAVL
ncbi:MAG: NACHT domain-containing protein [Cyanobacteria bacterium]|nr:NACHT domain-containing protein [Cyanobacteria bacterium GSL.Bin1]